MTLITRLGLEHLARERIPVTIPGVTWHEYTFPLEGADDARLEAEAIFKRNRKAEWVVLMDSAERSWVFRRGELKPVLENRPLPPAEKRLALPAPTAIDTTAQVVSSQPYADLSKEYPEVETTRRTCGVGHGPNWSPMPPLTRVASGVSSRREGRSIIAQNRKWARMEVGARQAVREAAMRADPRLTWVKVVDGKAQDGPTEPAGAPVDRSAIEAECDAFLRTLGGR